MTYTFLSFVSSAFAQRATFFTIEGFLTYIFMMGRRYGKFTEEKSTKKYPPPERLIVMALWWFQTEVAN